MKAHIDLTIKEIADWCQGSLLYGDGSEVITAINSDSREIKNKELFLPLVGEHFDGHNYIEDLLKKKSAAAFLTMHAAHKDLALRYNCPAVLCADTLQALGRLAFQHKNRFKLPVVGITGTNGKTTTKELLAALINEQDHCLKNKKNYNNEIGVPFTLFRLSDKHSSAVIEMGMNHAGEISRLANIVKPDLALITNIGEGHLEFLGSVENVALAKAEIMDGMTEGSVLFINNDTQYLDKVKQLAASKKIIIKTFGIQEGADIFPDSYKLFPDKIDFIYQGQSLSAPLYGIHNLYNIMGAIACAKHLKVSLEIIKQALSRFQNIDKRSQIIDKGYIVINDTYNSNPLSLRFGLSSLHEIYKEQTKIAVLSDMKELGELSEQYHRAAGREVVENDFARLYTWGEMAGWISEGARAAGMDNKSVKHFTSKDELIKKVLDEKIKNTVILVKGSRSMKMEEVVDSIIH